MIALSPKKQWDYVCEMDKALPKEQQTVWVLKALTPEQEAIADDNLGAMKDGNYQVRLGTQALLVLSMGLADVRNFPDETGNETTITYGEPSDGVEMLSAEFLGAIPKDVRAEIAAEILGASKPSEDELKN